MCGLLAFEEGIVSKRLGSRYTSGHCRDWLKFKNPNAPACGARPTRSGEQRKALSLRAEAGRRQSVAAVANITRNGAARRASGAPFLRATETDGGFGHESHLPGTLKGRAWDSGLGVA